MNNETNTTTTTPEQIAKAVHNAANYNMRIARKDGRVCITETKRGNLQLTYVAGVYAVANWNNGEPMLSGTAATIREFLKSVFTVIVDGVEM